MNKEHTDLHGLYHKSDVKLRTCREGASEGAVRWVPAFQKRNKSPQVWMQRTVIGKLLSCANGCFANFAFPNVGMLWSSAFAFRVLLWENKLMEIKG